MKFSISRKNLKIALLGLAGFIVFVLLMDNVVMPLYVKHGDETTIPSVMENPVDEARAQLEEKGFIVIIQDSLFDSHYPAGTVIDQNPYPGAVVKEGRRVYLTVSIGETPIIMPKLINVSPREAELTLRTFGLEINERYYEPSDIYPEGVVIGQSFPQGQLVPKGTKIDITISLGKLKDDFTVPDLVGKSLQEARQRLKLVNIKVGEVIYEERDNILPETVLAQSLSPGSMVEPGDLIDLTVSTELKPIPQEDQ